MTWESLWNDVGNYFKENAWNFLIFFGVLVGGFIVIQIIIVVTKRIMRRRHVDEMAIRFVATLLRFALWLLLIMVLLSIIGIPVSGITTTISAAVLAVGMALKDFLSNLASGIVLIGSKKYKTGDYIQVAGVDGCVVDINFLFTTLKTPNSTQVNLPNSTMVNSPVTNFGAYALRRVAITFPVAYESDTNLVIKTLTDVMKSCGLVHLNPAPECHLKELSASSIDFFCTCFCDNADYWDTYFYIMEHGFDELKRAGITVPFQQVEITQKVEKPSPIAYDHLPARVEKDRDHEERALSIEEMEDLSFDELMRYMAKRTSNLGKQASSAKEKGKIKTKENKKKTEEKPSK